MRVSLSLMAIAVTQSFAASLNTIPFIEASQAQDLAALGQPRELSKNTRDAIDDTAEIAKKERRYQQMANLMKTLIDKKGESVQLTKRERTNFREAYNQLEEMELNEWVVTSAMLEKQGVTGVSYKSQRMLFINNMEQIANEALELLTKKLLPNVLGQGEDKVFFLSMKGDFYRYLARMARMLDDVEDKKKMTEKADNAYESAYKMSEGLEPTNSVRLDLALTYSKFSYEILQDQAKARKMAKDAFDVAIAKLSKRNPNTDSGEQKKYGKILDSHMDLDSYLILRKLQDMLTKWTPKEASGAGGSGKVTTTPTPTTTTTTARQPGDF